MHTISAVFLTATLPIGLPRINASSCRTALLLTTPLSVELLVTRTMRYYNALIPLRQTPHPSIGTPVPMDGCGLVTRRIRSPIARRLSLTLFLLRTRITPVIRLTRWSKSQGDRVVASGQIMIENLAWYGVFSAIFNSLMRL